MGLRDGAVTTALSMYILVGGTVWRASARAISTAFAAVDARLMAVAIGLATTATGVVYSSTVAGGSDSYGYVSQADLWLAGSLKVDVPWADAVPWPNRRSTFVPLGYGPVEAHGATAMVPTYPPGLPIIMAGAKALLGQEALYWVVPISGGVLVLATFGIGLRLGAPTAGLLGAWLVATSPAFLYVLVLPMSDVPAAAAWAAAFCFLPGGTRAAALAAGLASGVAILIRPNLVVLAGPFGAWYCLRAIGDAKARREWLVRLATYVLGLLPALLVIAAVNQYLYGSPASSGYRNSGSLFALDHVVPNIRNYVSWLVQSQTPAVLVGVAALFLPIRRIWPGLPHRGLLAVIAMFVVALWGQYAAYLVFDAWWYLRFLLPAWPFIMIGVAAVGLSFAGPTRQWLRAVVVGAVVALGASALYNAVSDAPFTMWRGERRYVGVARMVQERLPEKSVLFAMQHSGSLRYYTGRLVARYDSMEHDWMDRAVAWFSGQGLRVFLVIDEAELPDVKRQFESQPGVMAVLSRVPVFIYRDVLVFDLGRPNELEAPMRLIDTFGPLRSVPPAAQVALMPPRQ